MVSFHKHLHFHKKAELPENVNMEELVAREPDPQVLSVVLVTITPTFSESVAGYTTLTSDDSDPLGRS